MYISINSLIPIFSHWAILHFNTIIYFDALFVPRLASEGLFKQASGSLAHVPFFLKLLFLFLSPSFPLSVPASFLLSLSLYCSSCTLPALVLESAVTPAITLRSTASFLGKTVFKIQNLGTSCAHCFCGATTPRPLSGQCYRHTHTSLQPHLFLYLSLCILKNLSSHQYL